MPTALCCCGGHSHSRGWFPSWLYWRRPPKCRCPLPFEDEKIRCGGKGAEMPERTVCKMQLIRYRISVVLSVGAIMVTLQGYSTSPHVGSCNLHYLCCTAGETRETWMAVLARQTSPIIFFCDIFDRHIDPYRQSSVAAIFLILWNSPSLRADCVIK